MYIYIYRQICDNFLEYPRSGPAGPWPKNKKSKDFPQFSAGALPESEKIEDFV